MKIHRCTKCEQREGYLVFRTTRAKTLQKYPYVGHYDSAKRTRRRWCSLNKDHLNKIEFRDDWYQHDYINLIKESRCPENQARSNIEKIWINAGKLLEKNGFLKNRIGERLFYDLNYTFLTEKYVEDMLPNKYSDKPKKSN